MKFLNELDELKILLNEMEEGYTIYALKTANINSLIENLLLVIEKDRFNGVQGYNYCKALKELLQKKKQYSDLMHKYKKVLRVYNSRWLNTQLQTKEKEFKNRTYKTKVFKDIDDVIELLNKNILI
jgi:hypothetical protein